MPSFASLTPLILLASVLTAGVHQVSAISQPHVQIPSVMANLSRRWSFGKATEGPLAFQQRLLKMTAQRAQEREALIAAAATFSMRPTVKKNILRTEGQWFMDSQNKVVILRGFNLAGDSKIPDFKPLIKDDAKFYIEDLKKTGANVIRLLWSWEAFQPQNSQSADWSYMKYYRDVIQDLHAANISTIVDVHQDAFSRFVNRGCGSGFPQWLIPLNAKQYAPRNTLSACKNWGLIMQVDSGLKVAWKAFHANQDGMKSAYYNMVEALAVGVKDLEGVIGFDLLNEPWGDEVKDIAPLYREAANRVRTHISNAIIFLCPFALKSSGMGVSKLPDDMQIDNAVFAPHYYDYSSFQSPFHWFGFPPSAVLDMNVRKAKKMGTPFLLGEYGAPPRHKRNRDYMIAINDGLDENFWSATQWSFTPAWTFEKKDGWNFEDFSVLDDKREWRDNWIWRPYLRSVAGVPLSFKVDMDTKSTSFLWDQDPTLINRTTEIFFPRAEFFGLNSDPKISIKALTRSKFPSGHQNIAECSYDDIARVVSCMAPQGGIHGITISPVP